MKKTTDMVVQKYLSIYIHPSFLLCISLAIFPFIYTSIYPYKYTTIYKVFIDYWVFSVRFCDFFLNSASSAAVLYLPGVCIQTKA